MRNFINIIIIVFFAFTGFAQTGDIKINHTDATGLKQGLWKKNYPDGKPRYEGNFVNDIAVGTFKYYYPVTSELSTESEFYDNGKKTRTKIYYKSGGLKAEGIFNNEKKDGLWKYYNEEKILISEEFYLNQKKHGTWKDYYIKGSLSMERNWENGMENGLWKEYFENGNLKAEKTYKAGKLEGLVTYYYPDGTKSMQGKYINSKKNGEWLFYLPDGNIKLREEYKEGIVIKYKKENGLFEEFYSNNLLKGEVRYKNGKKEGEFKEYYEMDLKKEPGKEEGHEDEQIGQMNRQKLKIEGRYLNDKLNGKIIYYNPDGSVQKEEIYKEGVKQE